MNALNNGKKVKDFSKEERVAYNRISYEKYKKARHEYAKKYYEEHKEDILHRMHNNYRRKCGLPVKA